MAVNKVINKSTKTHGAMRNSIEYVLKEEKIKQGFVALTGPYAAETINYDDIYRTWLEEKRMWDKDSGRMYAHNIISFHKDEVVTPEMVLEIGKEFCDRFFPDHQCLIGVHQDRDHLHCHILTNSVSYIDGHKLHQTNRDLEKQKDFTNTLCFEKGLTVTEKGHHFDGSVIEKGHVTAWSKDKYNLLANTEKKSYLVECAVAILESVPRSTDRKSFIRLMAEKGWTVQWEDKRKHIVFQNENGDKVRDANLEKTFSMKVSKEALTDEFERNNEIRNGSERTEREANPGLEQYYAEIESAIAGTGADIEAVGSYPASGEGTDREDGIGSGASGEDHGERDGDGPAESRDSTENGRDTKEFIRDLAAKERASGEKRNNNISEREDRDAERERQRIAAERAALETKRRNEIERTRERKRSRSHDIGR